ncbi:uncharacterized protein Tco025E_00829, partial [Trypanosoma conorhini]
MSEHMTHSTLPRAGGHYREPLHVQKAATPPRKRKSRRLPPGRAARRDPNRTMRAAFARGREARRRGPAAFALEGPALSRGALRLACCVRLAASGRRACGASSGPPAAWRERAGAGGRVKCAPR